MSMPASVLASSCFPGCARRTIAAGWGWKGSGTSAIEIEAACSDCGFLRLVWPRGAGQQVQLAIARRQAPGGAPTIFENTLVRWLWSAKPDAKAISEIEDLVST